MTESTNGAVVVRARRDPPVRRRRDRRRRAARRLRDIAPGKATAVMGPSGSGKSTLMHILAGSTSRRPEMSRSPDRDHDAGRQRPHEAAPRAHRLRVPVLQPLADAEREGEHPPSADHRRREARGRLVRPARRRRRALRPALAPALRAVGRAAAARRHRARSSRSRRFSSRTSRPEISTRRRAGRSSSSCAARSTSTARRSSW